MLTSILSATVRKRHRSAVTCREVPPIPFKQLLDSVNTIYGDGTSSRDYLDVRDLCNGIRLAMQAELGGFNVFHLASGKEVSILDQRSTAPKQRASAHLLFLLS